MIDTTARGYPEGRKSILNGLSFLERKSEIVYERRSKSLSFVITPLLSIGISF